MSIAAVKKLFLLPFFVLGLSTVSAQKIFAVNYASQADLKVWVAPYEHQADLKVFKVPYQHQANDNEGKWFFTAHAHQAQKKIFYVKYRHQADLIIFFVPYAHRAGWKDNAKKHLLYLSHVLQLAALNFLRCPLLFFSPSFSSAAIFPKHMDIEAVIRPFHIN